MLKRKLKERKCRFKNCRVLFPPVVEWQKFCSVKCRSAEQWRRQNDILRKAEKIIERQESGAA